MTLPELIKDYNLTFVNGERMYIINLDTNNMIFENTTPFYFRYLENEIYCNSWKNLLPSIFKIFNEINPKTNEELLCIKILGVSRMFLVLLNYLIILKWKMVYL